MLGQSAVLNIYYLEYFVIIVVNQIADRFVLDVSWGLEKSREKMFGEEGGVQKLGHNLKTSLTLLTTLIS